MIGLPYNSSTDFPESLKSRFFSVFADNEFIGISITDKNGKVVFINDAYLKITGQSRKEYLGKNMCELYGEKSVFGSAALEALRKGKEVIFEQNASAGKVFKICASPVSETQGHIQYVINYVMDISDAEYFSLNKGAVEDQHKNLKSSKCGNELIYKSEVMEKIVEKTRKISISDAAVLIAGPPGAGKGLVAELVHKNSRRCHKPFIKINCGAMPEILLEKELFGYEAGVFADENPKGRKGIFEEAAGGTVFLDEIEEMPMGLQSKLLRVIQNHEVRRIGGMKYKKVDFRLVASADTSIQELIESNKFRNDLYYRINIIEINLPGLDRRREDIPLLAEHFINMYNAKYSFKKILNPDAVKYLSSINYSENVRELCSIIERAVTRSKADVIDAEEIKKFIKKSDYSAVFEPY